MRRLFLALILPLLVALFVVARTERPSAAAPQADPVISDVRVTNIADGSFVVSWLTDVPSSGLVRSGTSADSLTQTTPDMVTTPSNVHYAEVVTNPETTYFFQVESGASVGNDSGVPFQITTGPTLLSVPDPEIFFQTQDSGGNPVTPVVLYFQLQNPSTGEQSQLLSVLIDNSFGLASYTPANIRTAGNDAFFSYDQATPVTQSAFDGQGNGGTLASTIGGMSDMFNIPPITLEPIPTSVTLASFQAVPLESGVRVAWETVSEQDTLGFNLLRATNATGSPQRLNEQLIEAQSASGAQYEWEDSAVTDGTTYFYWLESVEWDGSHQRHGPVSARFGTPTALTLASLEAAAPAGPLGVAALVVTTLLALAGLWRRSVRQAVRR